MNVSISFSVPPEMLDKIEAEQKDNESRSETIRRMLQTEDHIGYVLEQAQDKKP